MNAVVSPAGMEAYRRLVSESLLTGPAGVAELCDPRFKLRPHTKLISDEIARLSWGGAKRIMVMCPPQVGKSLIAAVWAPVWLMAMNPARKLIIGSYGNELAVTRGKQIRKIVAEQGWRFGLDIRWGEGKANDWQLTAGGGVRSAGVGGSVTGFSGDVGILDDLLRSRADADSKAKRDATYNFYSADFLSRLSPGAPIIAIGTPWHEDDALHRILAEEGAVEDGGIWRVIRLPAYAAANDPLGRKPGDPLTHPHIESSDTAALRTFWTDRERATTPRDWASLYLCDPKPMVNALVSEDLLRERTHIPPPATPVKAAVAIDPSGGGRDAAGVVGGWLGDDGRVYLTDDQTLVGPSEKWSRTAVHLAADLDADVIVYEGNFGGDLNEVALKSAWHTARREHPADPRFARPMPRLKKTVAKKGKLLRAEPVAQLVAEDKVRLGARLPALKHEWRTWHPTDTESPGRIDASVYLVLELLPVPGSESVVHTPPKPAVNLPPSTPTGGLPVGMGFDPYALGLPGSTPGGVSRPFSSG